MSGICSKKWGKHGILTQNLKNNLKFVNLMFPDSHFKMSFTGGKKSFTFMSYPHYQHKQ